MTISPEVARAKAAELLDLHDDLRSWRQVSRLHFPTVPAGTLNRIAKSGGAYLPQGRRELRALGLLERRKRTAMEKAITKMVRETRKALLK